MELNEKRIDKRLSSVYCPTKIGNKIYFCRNGIKKAEILKIIISCPKKEKLLYFSKGLVYDKESDKRYTANNFYTY
jgi:hypothetical protein